MPANVIRNGGFDEGFAYWVASGSPDTGGQIVDDPDQPGNPVFYVGSDTRKAQGPFPVESGDKWRLTFRLRNPGRGTTNGGLTDVSNGSSPLDAQVALPSTQGAWQFIDRVVTIPETGVTQVWVRFAAAGGAFHVDDVALTLIERGGGGARNGRSSF